MSAFTVNVTQVVTYTKTIHADSQDEAYEQVEELLAEGGIEMISTYGDISSEKIEVTPNTEELAELKTQHAAALKNVDSDEYDDDDELTAQEIADALREEIEMRES